jgi:pimeloyl-ACP methyl ester carboxylesterase
MERTVPAYDAGSVGRAVVALRLRRDVDDAFRTLPERYLGAPEGFDATYHVRLADLGRTFEVRCLASVALVRHGGTTRRPDVVLATDAATWLELRAGTLSGMEAFSSRRLAVRGALDLALGFEGRFRLPDDRPPHLRLHDVPVPAGHLSTLTLGAGPDVVLIHGLGSAKSSFLDLAAAMAAAGRRVHAVDLPGFGSSSKPLRADYGARWLAGQLLAWMDAAGIERAHVVGNSMGGRVALELALREPGRVGGVVALAPAVAFVHRTLQPVVWALRPELGVLPHRLRRSVVAAQLRAMFFDPGALDPAVADVVVDEFLRVYGSPAARVGFFKAARQLYLDEPFGAAGFYPRLAGLAVPALFVWGSHDALIPPGFARHVREWLPAAQQVVLQDCGHVPQVERPREVAGLVHRFLHADILGPAAGRAA